MLSIMGYTFACAAFGLDDPLNFEVLGIQGDVSVEGMSRQKTGYWKEIRSISGLYLTINQLGWFLLTDLSY